MAAVAERIETAVDAEPAAQALQPATPAAANDARAEAAARSNTGPALTPFAHPQASASRVLRPAVDVLEDAQGVTLTVDLPGVQREHLMVDVQGDRLSIDASLTLPVPAGLTAQHAEVRLSRYQRAFTLGPELDAASVDAKLEHGVLTVRIGKSASALPRRVAVRVG